MNELELLFLMLGLGLLDYVDQNRPEQNRTQQFIAEQEKKT